MFLVYSLDYFPNLKIDKGFHFNVHSCFPMLMMISCCRAMLGEAPLVQYWGRRRRMERSLDPAPTVHTRRSRRRCNCSATRLQGGPEVTPASYSSSTCPRSSLWSQTHRPPLCHMRGKGGNCYLPPPPAPLNSHQDPLWSLKAILLQTDCTA